MTRNLGEKEGVWRRKTCVEKEHRVPATPLSAERWSDFESSQLETPIRGWGWLAKEFNGIKLDGFSMKNPLKRYIATLHAACNAVLQRGLPAAVVLIVEEAPRATFPLLSAISDDLRENNLTLTLNVPVSTPRNTSPRAPSSFPFIPSFRYWRRGGEKSSDGHRSFFLFLPFRGEGDF